jgi:hypothetical protein
MWSAEEQTMVDLIELNGYGVLTTAHKEYNIVQIFEPKTNRPVTFRADTKYEAIRKAFTYWTKNNEAI